MISGPALLLGALGVGVLAVYVLRRFEALAALVAAGLALVLGVALWRIPLDRLAVVGSRPVTMGQPLAWNEMTLQITPASRAVLVFLLGMSAAAFILAWRGYQGRTFYPFGLAMVALWSVSAMLLPLALAPLGIALAAALAVFVIQAGRPGEVHGAWRQLLFPTLAVPLFLIAAWSIEQGPLNPDDQTPYRVAGWLLVVGFVLLLQPAPLHVAVPAVARQAPPVVAVFLWLGGQATVIFLLQRFLVAYPWLGESLDSASWLLWLGVLTILIGGMLAATQERLGGLVGYAGLYDYGVLLVALGLRSTAGLPTAVWLLLTRTVALLTIAEGAALIRHHMESDRFHQLEGAAGRLPWAVAALVIGGFGLAGMPLTAQFASRWSLLQLLAENDLRWSLLMLAGAGGVLIGVIRAARATFGPLEGSPVEREPVLTSILVMGLIAVSIALGMAPQLLTGPVAAVILPLSTFGP